ncbi:MAG: sensor histidine kinase [Betaproteobacteria bacterium]|nr:sensor histidine kinase [Betaproteobacteria bacterium]
MHSSEHQLQLRIQELEVELAASRAELQEFTYTVSHDLRAPLRHMVSFARLLEEEAGAQLTGESADFLRTITASADHMGVLLDALTALSRLGAVQARPGAVELAPLVASCVQEVQAGFVDRAVAVTVEVPASIEVVADESIVRQALVQVLDNAYKFTAKVAEPVIFVSVHQTPDGKVQLRVQDNGAGFSPAMQDKLFKVFGRLHSAKQFPGLGVGLLTAQRLLAKVGATISLVPCEQGGALACLTFVQAKK